MYTALSKNQKIFVTQTITSNNTIDKLINDTLGDKFLVYHRTVVEFNHTIDHCIFHVNISHYNYENTNYCILEHTTILELLEGDSLENSHIFPYPHTKAIRDNALLFGKVFSLECYRGSIIETQ